MSEAEERLFEQRFVGFIDLLGFKDLVEEAEKEISNPGHSLQRIQSILNFLYEESQESNGQHDLPVFENKGDYILQKELGNPRLNYISDCLIISCDGTSDGFMSLCNKITKFITDIATDGIFVRGGVSYGNMVHRGAILFGTGYQNAYLAESKKAKVPRVVIDEHATNFLNQTTERQHKLNQFTKVDKEDHERYLPPFPTNYRPYRYTYWLDYLLVIKGKLLFHLNRLDPRVNGFGPELRHLDHRHCWKEAYGYDLNFDGGNQSVLQKYLWLKDEFNNTLESHKESLSSDEKTSGSSEPRIMPIEWVKNHWGVHKDLGRFR